MTDSDDLIDALAPVVEALKGLRIRHYVGGSVASSFHGAARSTMDVDLVAELSEHRISEFIGCFGDEFYLSGAAVRDAVNKRSCFNLIHLPSLRNTYSFRGLRLLIGSSRTDRMACRPTSAWPPSG